MSQCRALLGPPEKKLSLCWIVIIFSNEVDSFFYVHFMLLFKDPRMPIQRCEPRPPIKMPQHQRFYGVFSSHLQAGECMARAEPCRDSSSWSCGTSLTLTFQSLSLRAPLFHHMPVISGRRETLTLTVFPKCLLCFSLDFNPPSDRFAFCPADRRHVDLMTQGTTGVAVHRS